jgi:hypothetical protein
MLSLRRISSMLFLAIVSLNLIGGTPNWELIAPKPEIHLKSTEPVSFKQSSYAYRAAPDPCQHYRRQEIAGFVLLSIGVGAIIGSAVMINRGVNDISANVNTINGNEPTAPNLPRHDIVLVSAGASLGLIGIILAPTGLALGITGAVRYHKYCGSYRSFYIAPSSNGTGLACRF